MMHSVYPIASSDDLEALLESCSDATSKSPSWPSSQGSSSGEIVFDEAPIDSSSFAVDDVMLDVFNREFDAVGMDWISTCLEPDTSETATRLRHLATNDKPPDFHGMQSKFSVGRHKSYIAPQSTEAWESRKTELHRLYIFEDKTLKEIMNIMKPKGFRARYVACVLTI